MKALTLYSLAALRTLQAKCACCPVQLGKRHIGKARGDVGSKWTYFLQVRPT